MTHSDVSASVNKTGTHTRRWFLQTSLLAGASALASSRFIETAAARASWDPGVRQTACRDATILVTVQLSGGNDGLNTVIPYTDGAYYASRPSVAIPPAEALRINDHLALNGMLAGLRELYDSGELALILGVGYPGPSHSHFRSTEIWRTASDFDVSESESWLARSLGGRCMLDWEDILRMTRRFRPPESYPICQLANGLALVAGLISAATPFRTFSLCQGGYDTHTGQMGSHRRLLRDLDSSLRAFVADLKAQGNFGRVLIMVFSEFGRGLAENRHGGTDHGSAAPMLVAGGAITGGIYGHQPSLTNPAGQLAHNIDFRSAYATVLEKWFDVRSQGVLARQFPALAFL